jgi:hypothetical protein
MQEHKQTMPLTFSQHATEQCLLSSVNACSCRPGSTRFARSKNAQRTGPIRASSRVYAETASATRPRGRMVGRQRARSMATRGRSPHTLALVLGSSPSSTGQPKMNDKPARARQLLPPQIPARATNNSRRHLFVRSTNKPTAPTNRDTLLGVKDELT